MKHKSLIFCILIVLIFIAAVATKGAWMDDSKSTPATAAPIQLKGDDATRIKDAYNALVNANRELQFQILQARYNSNAPKDWEFDLGTFQFRPPAPATPSVPASATKESKP